MPSGLVLIDKPQGFTSHDVVAKMRKQLGTKKVGHAGTLDPMATGLLILGIDAGTRLLTFFLGQDKQYFATIRLGQDTSTDDAEGVVTGEFSVDGVSEPAIQKAISNLTGQISQVPSSVSAIKVDGKRAYDIVRDGGEVELKARNVTISRFNILGEIRCHGPFIDLDVVVDCSSGTYIRALARDLGKALGTGGHLTALRRTSIGAFDLSRASGIEAAPRVIPMVEAVSGLFPMLEVDVAVATELIHGKRPGLQISEVTAITYLGELVAICEPHGSQMKSLLVFPGALNA